MELEDGNLYVTCVKRYIRAYGRVNFCYFLTSQRDGNVTAVSGLSPSTNLLTRSDFYDGFSAVIGVAAPKSPSQVVGMETLISAGFSTSVSGGNSTSGRVSTSGIVAELRPPRTCDQRTMEVVVSERLTSLGRIATGVGTNSRSANTEIDSLGRLQRPSVPVGTVSVVFSDIFTTRMALQERLSQRQLVIGKFPTFYPICGTIGTTRIRYLRQ